MNRRVVFLFIRSDEVFSTLLHLRDNASNGLPRQVIGAEESALIESSAVVFSFISLQKPGWGTPRPGFFIVYKHVLGSDRSCELMRELAGSSVGWLTWRRHFV